MVSSKQRRPSAKKPSRGRPPLGETERRRILDATAEVFLEKGFERASTNEIARRAGTSKQTLYVLFPTKADLFAGVMSAHTEQLFLRHSYYIESGKSPAQALAEMGCGALELFCAPEFLALYRIVAGEAANFPALARRLWTGLMERGYGLLADYLHSRRIGGPDYRRSAAQFVSLVLGDFILNATLNPDFKLTEAALRARAHAAAHDFLALHRPKEPRR